MRRLVFDEDRCKGCELCASACPKALLILSEKINVQGYHPITITDETKCTSCTLCARMCPETAIEVFAPTKEPIQ